MSALSRERKGELYILCQAMIWSLFPVVTILTFSTISPLYSAALSTFISSLFFALVLTVRGGWKQWNRHAPWGDIALASLFIGIFLYALEFIALRYTTAGNASIMNLMEIFFAFLILNVLMKHEPFRPTYLIGAICMVAGALIILLPKATGWHAGDTIIVIACLFPPLGNLFAQRARQRVSSEFIMFVRSIISGSGLLILALLAEPVPSRDSLLSSVGFLCINGFVLFGFSKLLWTEAMHHITITKANALGSIAPLFTLVFAYFLLGEQVQLYQLAAFFPILAGVILLTRKAKIEA